MKKEITAGSQKSGKKDTAGFRCYMDNGIKQLHKYGRTPIKVPHAAQSFKSPFLSTLSITSKFFWCNDWSNVI
jgi:hypothetical protein